MGSIDQLEALTARLRLRPLAAADEESARVAHAELQQDAFPFLLGFDPTANWTVYLEKLAAFRRGDALPDGWVAGMFLVASAGRRLIGRVSIRFTLNDALLHHGGHIGYAVRPEHRRRGFAAEMLAQALIIARAEGIGRVLVSCDDSNVASARTIERLGGVLDDVRDDGDGGPPWRRYWID